MMMALPTDDDLETTGAADAGEYLLSLHAAAPSEYHRFVESRKGSWQHEPKQKIWRCFEHMMMLIVRTIESNTSRVSFGAADQQITDEEAMWG